MNEMATVIKVYFSEKFTNCPENKTTTNKINDINIPRQSIVAFGLKFFKADLVMALLSPMKMRAESPKIIPIV